MPFRGSGRSADTDTDQGIGINGNVGIENLAKNGSMSLYVFTIIIVFDYGVAILVYATIGFVTERENLRVAGILHAERFKHYWIL